MPKLKATPFMLMLVKDATMLEHDVQSQYRFNRYGAFLFLIISILFPFFPEVYNHNLANLLFAEIASMSTFATFYGNMTSAIAGYNAIQMNRRMESIENQTETAVGLLGVEE